MKHLLSVLFTLFLFISSYATDSTVVYFKSGESTLSVTEQTKFNQAILNHKNMKLDSIVLIGFTDHTGTVEYNKDLSEKRVNTVQTKLLDVFSINITSYHKNTSLITNENRTEEEKSRDRKVEILWYTSQTESLEEPTDTTATSLTPQENLKQIFEVLKPEKKAIVLNPKKDEVLLTEGENLILVQKETFVREDGTSPKEVNLQVEEFNKFSSFIASGYQTMTTSGELLETGGMFNLKATDENGEELRMQKSMTLGFKRNENRPNNPGMMLFDGVDTKEGVKWEVSDNPTYKKPFSFDYEKLFMTALDYVGAQNQVAQSLVNVTKAVYKSTNKFKSIKDLKGEDKKMIADAIQTESIRLVEYKLDEIEEQERLAEEKRQQEVEAKQEEIRQEEIKAQQEQAQKEQEERQRQLQTNEYYFMNTTQLGKINCDDLTQLPGEKVNMHIDYTNHVATNHPVHLVFKSINGYMTTTNSNFLRIPKGQPATLVSLKSINGDLFLGLKEINISSNARDFTFKKVSEDELKRKLDGLMDI